MILFPLLSSVRENGEISLIVGRLALLCKADPGKRNANYQEQCSMTQCRGALEENSLCCKHFKAEPLFWLPLNWRQSARPNILPINIPKSLDVITAVSEWSFPEPRSGV